MNSESNKIKVKKIYSRDKSIEQRSMDTENTRREKASLHLYEEAKTHLFSQVYSKQYIHKNIPKQKIVTQSIQYHMKENNMDEIYKIIEDKIKESGYLRSTSGFDIYSEISDLIEEKDNGTYIFMSKPFDDVVFEYCVDIMADEFNLSYIKITCPEGTYHIDFDK